MKPVLGSQFMDIADAKCREIADKRFSFLGEEPVMCSPPRVWASTNHCFDCGEELDASGIVHLDEINNRVFCSDCVDQT